MLSVSPLGGEFPVNTHTPNQQVAPRLAMDADGGFVVVWTSIDQEGPASGAGVFLRRFASDGKPLGGDLQVNTYTTGNQSSPAVAMNPDGHFVIAWSSFGQDGAASGIYAQRFDPQGNALGGEFRVNTFTGGDEAYPSVAMDADGDFIVTWDTASPTGQLYDVYAQRYNAAGLPVGGEFRLNSHAPGQQFSSAVAMDDAGNFVVTWNSSGQDGSGYGIYARRFSASGAALGDDFRVNTYTTSDQLFPSVDMDADGDFVIAWQSQGQDGDETGIFAQRFDSTGAPVGDEFQVNTYTPVWQEGASVAMDAVGNFIITWESWGQDASLLAVAARAFGANGEPLGDDFVVNTHVVGDQQFPSVAVSPAGTAVIAWQSRHDGSENGIFAQRFSFDLIAPTVVAAEFRYQTAPHALRFRFSEDVSASLSADALLVQSIGGGPMIAADSVSYDPSTNTAAYTFVDLFADGYYSATLPAGAVADAAGNPLPADFGSNFFFLTGDANHDGVVNLADFNVLASNFGQSPRDFTQGDFNYDGAVNLADFSLLAARFGVSLVGTGRPAAKVFAGADTRDDDDETGALPDFD